MLIGLTVLLFVGSTFGLHKTIKPGINLSNKVVAISFGLQEDAIAIAVKCLLANATKVVLLDIDETVGQFTVAKLNSVHGRNRVNFVKFHVTKNVRKQFAIFIKKYGYFDYYINNIRIADEFNPETVLDTNVLGSVLWTTVFYEHMRKDKCGGTILIISGISAYSVNPFLINYKTSMFALHGYALSMGHLYNYRLSNVRVIELCPGFTYNRLTMDVTVPKEQRVDFEKYKKVVKWQYPTQVANAAMKVLKWGESGTAWQVVGGELKPAPAISAITVDEIDSWP